MVLGSVFGVVDVGEGQHPLGQLAHVVDVAFEIGTQGGVFIGVIIVFHQSERELHTCQRAAKLVRDGVGKYLLFFDLLAHAGAHAVEADSECADRFGVALGYVQMVFSIGQSLCRDSELAQRPFNPAHQKEQHPREGQHKEQGGSGDGECSDLLGLVRRIPFLIGSLQLQVIDRISNKDIAGCVW